MIIEISLFVTLVELVDRLSMSTTPTERGRGRAKTYDARLLKNRVYH